MKPFVYCPYCSEEMKENKEKLMECECGFIHYDNPVPVVTCVIPVTRPLGPAFDFRDSCLIVVKRGVPPFKGMYCLPCGYMNRHEPPKAACAREVQEETGLEVRLEQILCACNPMPGEINQMTLSYLGRVVGGKFAPGDDAEEAVSMSRQELFTDDGDFVRDDIICFRSHRMLIANWFDGMYGNLTGNDLML